MPLLEHNGYRIDYREAGQGETVILLHSSATGLGQWRKLMEALAPRFTAVAYNFFGCGQTTPWPYKRAQTLADQVELTLAVARRSDGPVHLVGHSFGGTVALKAALALESRLASLTLLEPNPFYVLRQHQRLEAYAESCALRDDVKRHGAQGEWETVAQRFADYWNAPGAWAAMNPERRQGFLAMLPSNVHEWDAVMAETNPIEAWAPLAQRTLMVSARNTVRPIREIVDLMYGLLPGIQWAEIPEGGHMAPVVRPDLVNPLVLQHIEAHRA